MGYPALGEFGIFGFRVQNSKGSYLTPNVWLPLYETETISYQPNYTILEWADGRGYQSQYVQAGEWAAGDIVVPEVPGVTEQLISWLMAVDSYQQGKWASVILDCEHAVKKLTDVKVVRFRVDWATGEVPVLYRITVAALLYEAGSDPSPTMPQTDPYMFNNATVQLEKGGAGLSTSTDITGIALDVDKMVQDPAMGLRLGTSLAPQQLYNTARPRVAGSFDRDFVDSAVYDDFIAGTEAALTITDTVGGNSVVHTLPRLLYREHPLGISGRHDELITEDGVGFIALGSTDGATAALGISATDA